MALVRRQPEPELRCHKIKGLSSVRATSASQKIGVCSLVNGHRHRRACLSPIAQRESATLTLGFSVCKVAARSYISQYVVEAFVALVSGLRRLCGTKLLEFHARPTHPIWYFAAMIGSVRIGR